MAGKYNLARLLELFCLIWVPTMIPDHIKPLFSRKQSCTYPGYTCISVTWPGPKLSSCVASEPQRQAYVQCPLPLKRPQEVTCSDRQHQQMLHMVMVASPLNGTIHKASSLKYKQTSRSSSSVLGSYVQGTQSELSHGPTLTAAPARGGGSQQLLTKVGRK